MNTRILTAKVTFDIFKNHHSYQWTAGDAYNASWKDGWICMASNTADYWFGGSEKEHVYENFVFWGEKND